MNYIKRLEADRHTLENGITEIASELDELIKYLQSDKFACGSDLDGYVNTSDVLARLSHARGLAMPNMLY